jgi:uncharacterized phage protein (TIGR01671 family)
MTKEIKFRAWIYDCEYMIYSNKSKEQDNYMFRIEDDGIEVWYFNDCVFYEGGGEIHERAEWQRQDVKVMPFTGLKDRTGEEIYEGDILTFDLNEWNRGSLKPKEEWEYPKWQVTWDVVNGCWDTGGGTTAECPIYKEVIGNIYENPELI